MKRMVTAGSSILLVFASLWSGGAAMAHDEVVSVYPESGSSVDAGVIDLNITFNEEVLTTENATGFDVVVSNSQGEPQTVACISPMGSSLSARVAIGKAGEYKVLWHSVSSDGHPSEGEYSFKVANDAEVDADQINNCPRLLIAPAPDDPSAIAYSVGDVTSNDNTPIEIGILVLVVILVIGSAVWVTRKRKK
jgi:methionine-rich copper-binding protein CopC